MNASFLVIGFRAGKISRDFVIGSKTLLHDRVMRPSNQCELLLLTTEL